MTWDGWLTSDYAKNLPGKENIAIYDFSSRYSYNNMPGPINAKYVTSEEIYKNIWLSYKLKYDEYSSPGIFALINL